MSSFSLISPSTGSKFFHFLESGKFLWCSYFICIYWKLIMCVCCWKIHLYFLRFSIGTANLQTIKGMRLKGVFSIQSFNLYWVAPPPIFNFFTRYSLTRGSLAAVIKHWKSFHFSTEILMLHCYWNNTHTDHTSSLVNGSIAEIFCFCGSI